MAKSSYDYAELAGINITLSNLSLRNEPELIPIRTWLEKRAQELNNK